MLNLDEVKAFEQYIRSGKLECDFSSAGEYERGQILELLEQIMDLAELADEAATRIIFPGIAKSRADTPSGNS